MSYDTGWSDRFAAEQAVLTDAIGSLAIGGIHHVEAFTEAKTGFILERWAIDDRDPPTSGPRPT